MAIRIVQVDAFTSRAFAGNPAAVCVLQSPKPDEWMRNVLADRPDLTREQLEKIRNLR